MINKKKYFWNIIYILFVIVFIFINILFLNNKMPKYIVLNFPKNIYIIILIILILVSIIICTIIYFMHKKQIPLEKMFLVVAIPLGFLFLTLLPVGFVPDEINHFARSYEISTGGLVSNKSGTDIPVEIINYSIVKGEPYNYNKILKNISKNNSNQVKNYTFYNTSLYNFVCYIPQVIGILIGRCLNMPILIEGYLGRIINYLCWLILIYYAIKLIPFAKVYLVIISLLPITMQEAVSLSPDALTFAMSMFLIAYILSIVYNKEIVSKKDYILLALSCIVLSLCKIVYLPICLSLFIIPKEKFKSMKDKNIKIFIIILIVILLNLLWLKKASVYLVETNPGVNSNLQINYILSHPFSYVKIIFATIIERYEFYFNSMLGGLLGSFNVSLSYFYPVLSIFALIVCTICDFSKNNIIKFKDKVWLGLIFISVVILIFTSLYVQWTPLKMNTIDGVQGRYFLPILIFIPILICGFKKRKFNIDFADLPLFGLAFSLFANLSALIYIFYVNL